MRKRICALFTAICLLFGLAWNGIALSVSAVSFDDVAAQEGLPEGWVLARAEKAADKGKTTIAVVADPDNANNQVLQFAQPEKRSSWYGIKYNIEPTSDPVILEYRYRVTTGASGDIFLPSLVYAADELSYPLLLRSKAGVVAYSNSTASGATWIAVETVETKENEWHTVRHVVDITNKACELYLDGSRIELDTSIYTFADDKTQISGVMLGARASAKTAVVHYDDINVTVGAAGESLTFEETDVTVPVSGGKYLKPVFAPVNTAIQGITYTSSDETVATVSADGMIFGIKEGTATVTATPALPNIAPVEIAVTVGAEVKGTITVPAESLELPVGGHDFIAPSIEFEGGFIVDDSMKFETSAPEVVTMDEWGEVLAISAGTATITIRSMANLNITKEIAVTVSEPQVMQTIYVAPNGTGDGASAAAPTTLDGAAAILAAIDKAAMTGNIEVILADGYYYRTDALKLTDAHGGNNLYTVVFKAAEGANPTIGGGVSIEGSKFEDTNNDGIYEYNLSELNLGDTFNTRQLYVDNVRAVRARGKAVHAGTTLKNAEYLHDTDGTTLIGFLCDNEELLTIKRPQDLDFVYKNGWINSRCPVASVEKTEDGRVKVIMEQPAFYEHTRRQDFIVIKPTNVCWYENALEILDEPGEWYFNAETQVLYYMPKLWEKMADVTVTLPVFDNWEKTDAGNLGLITILGTSSEQQAQNIRFEGITFADTTWTRPDTYGLPHVQNNNILNIENSKYSQMPIDAAVTVKMANSVNFLDCNFTRLGGGAINMYDGVQNSLIQGCHFYDLSAGAIYIGHPSYTTNNYNPDNLKDRMKNVDVLNNYIHDVGVDYLSSSAVTVCYAEDVDLCYNEIFNVPYSAFHLGYGWNKSFTTYTRNMNVSGNFIHDFFYSGLGDGGAIYTNGWTGGDEEHWNIQTGNYIRNQGASTAALYADSGTSWWKAYGNVVDITEGLAVSGVEIQWARRNSGNHNLTFDNYYAGRELVGPDSEEKHIYYYNNTYVADPNNWPAEAQAIIAASGLESAYAGLRNNQVERIVTAADHISQVKYIVEMNAGKTFDLDTKLTDGKDNPVDTSKAVIYYESLNTDIATVDQNGVITGVADGQATVRIHVVSNDVWSVKNITVYVGDDLAEVLLRNQDAEISLTETGGNKYMNPYGVSKSGREVSLDKVTWSIADETVAAVDQNGVLSPVGAGETVLTVTAKKLDVTLSATYKIIVRAGSGMVVDYMDDMFLAENADKWYHGKADGSWELTEGERITAQVNRDATYYGRKFDGELLTFRLRLDPVGTWPSIVLRAMADDKPIGRGGSGYIICFLDSGVQLQRFNGTARTVLYGTIGGNAAIYGPDYPHPIFFDKEFHEFQVGAINEEAGVRLILYIDGVEVFNCVDTGEDAHRDPGYFGLVGDGKTTENLYDGFTLVKMGPTEVKHNLTLESDIDFSFFVPKSAVAESGLTATVIQDRAKGFEDKTVTLDQANWESYTSDGVEYWRIRYADVAAKEMTDKLTLVLRDASGVLFTDSYSVAQYAKERIENSTNENMKNLMNIMLHYGAAAQIYFDYKTDDLANEGLAAASTASLRAAANAVSTVKHNLTLESNIDFSFFIPKSDVAESGLTATILHDRIEGYDDKSSSLTQDKWETLTSGGVEYWRIRYTDVAAKEIADSLTLTVTDGTNTVVTDSYSVLQYAQERVQNSSNENMKTLMQMLQAYGAAARLYFEYTAN